jgi:glycosyltransferase involved in cell wall biosynthesis
LSTTPSVLLVAALASERWTSIDLYHDDLRRGFAALAAGPVIESLQANPDRDAGWVRRQLDFHVTLPHTLRGWLDRRPTNAIHFLDQNYGYFCRSHVLRRRFASVVTCHDLAPLRQRTLPWFRERRYRRRVSGMAWASAVVCVSQTTARDVAELLEIDPARISVNPPGVDPRFRVLDQADAAHRVRHSLGLAKTGPWMLHVGSNDPRKNITLLVAGLARLRKSTRSLRLIKIGPPIAGLGEAAIQPGHVDLGTLVALYNLADVVVLPSSYEGFGRPLLEGMACGTPCVVAHASALPEVGGEAVLYHPVDDAGAFAGAVQQILDDPSTRARLASAGIARAAGFTWRDHVARLMETYQAL